MFVFLILIIILILIFIHLIFIFNRKIMIKNVLSNIKKINLNKLIEGLEPGDIIYTCNQRISYMKQYGVFVINTTDTSVQKIAFSTNAVTVFLDVASTSYVALASDDDYLFVATVCDVGACVIGRSCSDDDGDTERWTRKPMERGIAEEGDEGEG
jgi:hypothetical protein